MTVREGDPGANIHDVLKKYWGYDQFRPLQEDVINSVLNGNDTLALMPTGGGKSLCYQIPGLVRPGLCLVISPLIALMKDQVENLRKKNITAYSVYSGMSRHDVTNVLRTASQSNCKFLFVSPERLETNLFKEYLPALDINLVAVDEAHCISQWGYDFRPPYLRIAALREEIPDVPILALTASATTEVQKDICEKLQFRGEAIFRQSFARPNLSYSVFRVESKINKIIEIVKNVGGSSIVYCRSRKRTQEIADLLRMQGMAADFYHAGLGAEERNSRQESWIGDQTRIIVCTNAFGMGIDKPNVRVVIHADAPDCLENYYQEAGRAGRDGQRSYAVLLYNEQELTDLKASVSLRYPPPETIRQVYQSIANYLQLPSGSGEGNYYPIDIRDLIKKFKLDAQMTMSSFKALEQDGWLNFNEQVFLPSTAQFISGKEYVYQFEKDQPELEPMIKALLRSYEGIFEYPASISEVVLARLMGTEKNEIKRQLGQLHAYHVIAYSPQKDTPQVLFLRNRVKAEDLSIDLSALNKRKEKFEARLNSMIEYIHSIASCRSRMVAAYFGDNAVSDCGICDNCLQRKSAMMGKEEFNRLNSQIMESLQTRSLHANELMQHLKGTKKEKAWEVINFLQSEDRIEVDKAGWIRLKRSS